MTKEKKTTREEELAKQTNKLKKRKTASNQLRYEIIILHNERG